MYLHNKMAAPQPVPIHDVMPGNQPQSVTWRRKRIILLKHTSHLILPILAEPHPITSLVLLITRAVHARVITQRLVTVMINTCDVSVSKHQQTGVIERLVGVDGVSGCRVVNVLRLLLGQLPLPAEAAVDVRLKRRQLLDHHGLGDEGIPAVRPQLVVDAVKADERRRVSETIQLNNVAGEILTATNLNINLEHQMRYPHQLMSVQLPAKNTVNGFLTVTLNYN